MYFICGVIIRQKALGLFSFLFLIPVLLLNVIALVLNPKNFPTLSPIIFILAVLAFTLGQIVIRKDIRKNHPFLFFSFTSIALFTFFFIPFYYTPNLLFNKNELKISGRSNVFASLAFINLDETPYQMNSLIGKTVLIDNWYLNCYPCLLKLPSLQSLSDKLLLDTSIKIITVINGKIDSLESVKEFLKKHPELKIPVLYDRFNTLGNTIKIDGYPIELIIGKDGYIKERYDGFDKDQRLVYINNTFKKLVNYNK